MRAFYFKVSLCTYGDTPPFPAETSKKCSLLLNISPMSTRNIKPSLLELGFTHQHFVACSGGERTPWNSMSKDLLKRDHTLGFIICEIFTVIALQDWVGWGIFTVIPGYPGRANGESQHLEARPELQCWLRSELFTVKSYRTGPFSK